MVLRPSLGNAVLSTVTASAAGPVSVTACASNLAGDCCGTFTAEIQVKYCQRTASGGDYYVYRLKRATLCDMAYCAVGRHELSNSMTIQCFSTLHRSCRHSGAKYCDTNYLKKMQLSEPLRQLSGNADTDCNGWT